MNRQRCIFCENARTTKRGEHVWDNWINREHGKQLHDPSTTYHYGEDGLLLRSYPSVSLNVTVDVVCDPCNNTWMSHLTSATQPLLEPIIRRDKPADFDEEDIVTIASFAFMKAAVLDWSTPSRHRTPCISRTACTAFKNSLTDDVFVGDVAIPAGVQIWLARYRRTHKMEAFAFSEEMTGKLQFKGYRILVITYVVGSLVVQLTFPRWSKRTRNCPAPPFFHDGGDPRAVVLWPDVNFAYWPPLTHIGSSTLESFRERFRRIRIQK